MKKFGVILFIVILSSCATIPPQSISLTDAIIDEGQRMHELNITLLNKMFKEKRERVDLFIENEYTPKFLDEFKSRIPAGVDVEAELPNILKSLIPQINKRRDDMQSALEEQRIKLVTKLEQDYKVYRNATSELKELLKSAVKVTKARQDIFDRAKELTNNRIDLNQVENAIDSFIIDAGNVGENVIKLNDNINSIINQ